MADLEDLLKKRIPTFQQENPLLDSYLEATGNHFDGFRNAINQLKGFRDYNDIPFSLINQIGRDFGIEFPRNLEESMKRNIIRDIFDIYRRLGTDETVIWLFRVIGWTVTRREAWLLNPEQYISGLKKKLEDDNFTPRIEDNFDFKPMKYIRFDDFVYGNIPDNTFGTSFTGVKDEDYPQGHPRAGEHEGTFFYGEDFYNQISYNKIPIIGEEYNGFNALEASERVMKLPYMVIQISEGDYALDFTDYQYTERERYYTIVNLINYMLYTVVRPSHVRIIVILEGHRIEDVVEILNDDQHFSVTPSRNNTNPTISDNDRRDAEHEPYILTDGTTHYEVVLKSTYDIENDPNKTERVEGYFHRTQGSVPNDRE